MTLRPRLFYGWYVVAATFLLLFGGFGAVYSFGAFFLSLSEEFDTGRAAISGVFSGAVLTLFVTGAFSGMLADRFGPRPVIGAGVTAIALGLVGAAAARELWQLLACYTFGVGIGVGFVYVPAISTVQRWFDRRRGLASGIAVTGIGVGTLVTPIIVGMLLDQFSWRLVFGWIAASIVLFGAIGVAVIEADPGKRGLEPDGAAAAPLQPRVDCRYDRLAQIFLSRPFVLLYAASSILAIPVFVPFVHVVASAQDMGIDGAQAVSVLGLIGLGSTAGRFVVGGLADRLGRRRALILMLAGIGIAYLFWLSATGLAMLYVFAVIFGVCYGAYVALTPALIADYFAGPKLSSVIGVQYTAAGLGSVLGPVLTGHLFDINGSYTLALLIAASCSAAACYLVAQMPEPVPAS